jgi:hypothetical protein
MERMTRELRWVSHEDRKERTITLSIGIPQPDEGDWTSTIEIVGFDNVHRNKVWGVDPMQAMMDALALAPILLRLLSTGGELTYEGKTDLGFRLSIGEAEQVDLWRIGRGLVRRLRYLFD